MGGRPGQYEDGGGITWRMRASACAWRVVCACGTGGVAAVVVGWWAGGGAGDGRGRGAGGVRKGGAGCVGAGEAVLMVHRWSMIDHRYHQPIDRRASIVDLRSLSIIDHR